MSLTRMLNTLRSASVNGALCGLPPGFPDCPGLNSPLGLACSPLANGLPLGRRLHLFSGAKLLSLTPSLLPPCAGLLPAQPGRDRVLARVVGKRLAGRRT